MINPLKLVVLAALTAFLIPSTPTRSFAADAQIPPHASKMHQIFCESPKDCPKSDDCSIKPGHKTGVCVHVKEK